MSREHGFYAATADASLIIQTAPCSFMGVTIYASAAGTLTIVDGTAEFIGPLKLSALEFVSIVPAQPIALNAGLSATNSGSCQYTIFYGAK